MSLTMTSDRQKEANRRNAQRSTGPKTPEGRLVSSRNATRHGVLSQKAVAFPEDEELFSSLLDDLMEEHVPVTRTEKALVERLAVLFWRERRLAQSESHILKAEAGLSGDIYNDIEVQRSGGASPLKLIDHLLVGRYQTMLTNQVSQTLRELRSEQNRRAIDIDQDD
ncbi:hypothetical protein [Erythrobacter sp.]|uniref:hypothetical protein n=1 Tax=Erythrobacter sp. TaxID=1042 RepID=UPI001425D2DA|nr:hypothetical protein [Erythrobacter sp.]QIQ87815.1 MAG: hypothetical protein G9473_14810 [Erythrobacter sp.]